MKSEKYEKVQVSDVQRGDVIRLPGEDVPIEKIPADLRGKFNMKISVWQIEPSVHVEGAYVITAKRAGGPRHRMPGDFVVRRVVQVKKPEPLPPPKCTCHSHLGKLKRRFGTRNAALRVAMKYYRRHGMQAVYECPTVKGIFHVSTQDQEKFRD